jgi:ABC-type transport system substrate-binding protein
LADAGYVSGLSLDIVINPATVGLVDAAQVIASQFAKIGVTAKVVEKEGGLIRQQYATHDVGDIVITGLGGTQGDGGLIISIAFEPGGRYCVWSDPGLGELRKAAESAVEAKEQQRLYTALQQAVKDQCPAIPLWESYNIYAYNASLKGWVPHATSLTITRDAYWK